MPEGAEVNHEGNLIMSSTTHTPTNVPSVVWKEGWQIWLAIALIATAIATAYSSSISELIRVWEVKEEYSYGYMIPFISAFLIWQRQDKLREMPFQGSWWGVAVVFVAILLFVLGRLSALYLVEQISLVILIAGIALAWMGWVAFRLVAVPVFVLLFMIPLPQFFLTELSQHLQFLSSEIGVAVIRLFGISVNLEGNIIDLGSYKLQVVEACSGLRYLFPLMTLGFIAAYFFHGAFWKRLFIFVSTIPITVLMNSFRIGVIGVMVDRWGQSMAEGFLHDFEGWVIFMACTALLVLEMWVLARIGQDRLPLRQAFGIDFPEPASEDSGIRYRTITPTYWVSGVMIVVVALAVTLMPPRTEIAPERKEFAEYPMSFPGWEGRSGQLESVVLDVLRLNDYLLADYVSEGGDRVNFYIAYYATQRQGESAHSPRTCIPGGGWEMTSFTQIPVDGIKMAGAPLQVNRAIIQKGEYQQLVYYWFQQRGRIITNEYLVKWFIFWDSLTKERSDGALVRLVHTIPPGTDAAEADHVLKRFTAEIAVSLDDYIPR